MSNPTIGERLKTARENLPASIYQVSRDTKIRVDFIDLMEKDNFRFMSGATYIKGLLGSYARYVGLPAEEILQQFDQTQGESKGPSVKEIFKEPAAAPRTKRPNWLIASVVTASLLVGFSLVGLMSPSTPRVAPPPKPDEVASAQSTGAPKSPEAVAALPPQYEGVQLTISITGKRCWVRVEADGDGSKPLYEGTLFSGATETFKATDQIKVTFGDIGAVEVTINGRKLSIPGESGQVGTFVFTPDTTSLTRG